MCANRVQAFVKQFCGYLQEGHPPPCVCIAFFDVIGASIFLGDFCTIVLLTYLVPPMHCQVSCTLPW